MGPYNLKIVMICITIQQIHKAQLVLYLWCLLLLLLLLLLLQLPPPSPRYGEPALVCRSNVSAFSSCSNLLPVSPSLPSSPYILICILNVFLSLIHSLWISPVCLFAAWTISLLMWKMWAWSKEIIENPSLSVISVSLQICHFLDPSLLLNVFTLSLLILYAFLLTIT